MTISPKTKKILAVAGGVTLLAVCIFAMTKCSGNAGERDAAREDLAVETSRVDSLQNELNKMAENRDAWHDFAIARGDTIRAMRDEDLILGDSIVVLNDSIEHLVAANDSLQKQLNKCRGTRRTVKKTTRPGNNNCAPTPGNVAGNAPAAVVTVPAPAATNVNVNGGCGNTVNVNNGTINNYYNSDAGTVKIKSSASATAIVRVVKTR